MKSAFDGKKISPSWSTEGTKRLTAVTLVTFSLLILRLHVMGSKLPVFTRYIFIYSTLCLSMSVSYQLLYPHENVYTNQDMT